MKKFEFKSGTIEVYETKEEMIGVLYECLGKKEVDSSLTNRHFKDIFNPNADYCCIKKVIAIKVPSEVRKTLMCYEHYNCYYDRSSKRIDVKFNTYANNFTDINFSSKSKDVQKCFIEYYNSVRDDDRIEKILEAFKVGNKAYFAPMRERIIYETINYIGLQCERELIVEIGTKERKEEKIEAIVIEDGKCECYNANDLYTSLESSRGACLARFEVRKIEIRNELEEIEKLIDKVENYRG